MLIIQNNNNIVIKRLCFPLSAKLKGLTPPLRVKSLLNLHFDLKSKTCTPVRSFHLTTISRNWARNEVGLFSLRHFELSPKESQN